MPREWVIRESSGYQGLVLQDCALEDAGPGEVRLRIEAFALNWGDMDLMLDRYSFSFPKFPARIGIEAAGIVDQIGEGVTGIEVGERYCTLPYFYYNRGASAEFRCHRCPVCHAGTRRIVGCRKCVDMDAVHDGLFPGGRIDEGGSGHEHSRNGRDRYSGKCRLADRRHAGGQYDRHDPVRSQSRLPDRTLVRAM